MSWWNPTTEGTCGDPSICTYSPVDKETGCCRNCPNTPGGSLHTIANGFRLKPKAPER